MDYEHDTDSGDFNLLGHFDQNFLSVTGMISS